MNPLPNYQVLDFVEWLLKKHVSTEKWYWRDEKGENKGSEILELRRQSSG